MRISIDESRFPIGSELVLKESSSIFQIISLIILVFLIITSFSNLAGGSFVIFAFILHFLFFVYTHFASQSVDIKESSIILNTSILGFGPKLKLNISDLENIEYARQVNHFAHIFLFKYYTNHIVFQTSDREYNIRVKYSSKITKEYAEKLNSILLNR